MRYPQAQAPTVNSGRRQAILDVLRDSDEPLSIVEVALALEIHANTVRFHVDRLVADGLVSEEPPAVRNPGRPPKLLRAIRTMDPAGPRDYRLLAEILVDTLARGPDPQGQAVAAGREWGQRLAAASGGMLPLLNELGFSPQPLDAQATRIALRSCPFLEVAQQRPDIVCRVHHGLMQGALQAWNRGGGQVKLVPFAQPDACLAHLQSADLPADLKPTPADNYTPSSSTSNSANPTQGS